MDNISMNKQLGTKWFTFYTKVRPWLACLTCLTVIMDFAQYTDVYLNNFFLLVYFVAAIAQPILAVIVAIKSEENYGDFVRFVKGVLLFETINMAYQQGIQQYIKDLEFDYALLIFAIVLVIGYFTWYRLNVKYFEKRIVKDSSYNVQNVERMENNIQTVNQQSIDEVKSDGLQSSNTAVQNSFPKWIIAAACAVLAIIIASVVIFMPRHDDYTVRVVDEIGNPVSSVMVTITDKKGAQKTKMTDDNGLASFTDVLVGKNTVTLDVAHREIMNLSKITLINDTYTLERKARELKAVVRDDIKLIDIYGAVDDGTVAYRVSVGEYDIFTQAGKTSYLIFEANQSGVYKVSFNSADNDMTIGYYGMPMYVQNVHCGDLDYDGKSAFELVIQDHETPYVLGINSVSGDGCNLVIERLSDPPFDPQFAPWTVVKAQEKFKEFSLPAGATISNIDITDPSVSVVLGDDGYYYTKAGKPVYVRIGSPSAYLDVSIAYIAGLADKNFGQNFGGYVYDENGEFVGKYSYNEMLKSYYGYTDEDDKQHPGYCDANGLYPLTAELAEAIKCHGNSVGWWNPNAANYLFSGVPVVHDNAWLFLCCTAN